MATDLANLQAAKSGAVAKLAAALTGDYSKAIELKPNFNSANSADRISYVRELRATIADLNTLITTEAGAWEIISEVDT